MYTTNTELHKRQDKIYWDDLNINIRTYKILAEVPGTKKFEMITTYKPTKKEFRVIYYIWYEKKCVYVTTDLKEAILEYNHV